MRKAARPLSSYSTPVWGDLLPVWRLSPTPSSWSHRLEGSPASLFVQQTNTRWLTHSLTVALHFIHAVTSISKVVQSSFSCNTSVWCDLPPVWRLSPIPSSQSHPRRRKPGLPPRTAHHRSASRWCDWNRALLPHLAGKNHRFFCKCKKKNSMLAME